MDRRKFLCALAGATTALRQPRPAWAESPFDTRVLVDYAHPGVAIASEFIGLSYESAMLVSTEYFSPENRSVLGLLRTLGRRGVLRIGGKTSERTFWQASADMHPPHDSYVITPAAIDHLAGFLRVLGWRLIYGLNLARGTPASPAEEAAYVAQAAGPHLLAFQIGNEPDGFGLWSAVRPKNYDVSAFLSELRPFYAAVRARVPDAPIAGPAIAFAADWIAAFAEATRDGTVLLTRHYYADGPARAVHISLPKLLRAAPQIEPILANLQTIGRTYGLPYRIAETNSIFAEGHPGVSDTFGASLWGLELMFQIAQAGGAGINFHTGDAKFYTPIGPGEDGRRQARPVYYAMLMFQRACSGVPALVPAQLDPHEIDLVAYALRTDEGALRVCVINKDLVRAARVRIDSDRRFDSASLLRLTGRAVDATTGVTLGGAAVDDFGGWSPQVTEGLRKSPGFVVDVPAASAALVTMRAS